MRKSKSFDSLYILHAFEGEKKQKKTGLMFFPPKKVEVYKICKMSKILNVFPSTVFPRARWPGWFFKLGSWIT
jgi:hypothetical protein